MEQLTPQLMHKLVFTVLMHGLNDGQAMLALKLLIDALASPNSQIREMSVVALADLAVPVGKRVEGLILAMRDVNPRVRRRAARALADQGPAAQEGLQVLAEGLSDPDASVRRDCAGAIGRLGPAAFTASAGLVRMLMEPEHRTRAVVGVALQRVGRGAVPALLIGVRNPAAELRARCATLLGKIAPDDPQVAAVLREVAKDADEEVRARAGEALRWAGPPPAAMAQV